LNPRLQLLRPYPFERLRRLLGGVAPPAVSPINLSIGEPKHATPAFILEAFRAGAKGLASYPATQGLPALREAIAGWLQRRFQAPKLDPERQVLPVLGSREALFSFAQCVIDGSRKPATVVVPNPFYQIYEGAALLAGAEPYCVNSLPENHFVPQWRSVPDEVWRQTQLLYVCSPDNPTGRTATLDEWRLLFDLSDRYGFVIAADECYSEIYFDEHAPPLGALTAAARLGRDDCRRLVVFSSLSKRSNVPGMRSGLVAGDAEVLGAFLLYRTYHGSAMSPAVGAASVAAWADEDHVAENRALYREKFTRITPVIAAALPVQFPDAAFYLWAETPCPDTEFAQRLFAEEHVTVLPGSLLGREAHGRNPGAHRIRIALVADRAECEEAAARIVRFVDRHWGRRR